MAERADSNPAAVFMVKCVFGGIEDKSMARLHFCFRGKGRDIVLNDFLHQFFLFLRTGTRTEHFQIPRRRDDWEGHVSAMMVVFLYWGLPFMAR